MTLFDKRRQINAFFPLRNLKVIAYSAPVSLCVKIVPALTKSEMFGVNFK